MNPTALSIFVAVALLAADAANPPAPAAEVPPVLLTETHRKRCKLKTGDAFPAMTLPRLNGQPTDLKSLYGKQATIVVLWDRESWMTRAALSDLAKDIPRLFGKMPVELVGIAVGQSPAEANKLLAQTGAKFPHLLDADAAAAKNVSTAVLPQIYALDGAGTVVWFDIEYSESTRRELRQALEALVR
ncbi:redoxin family protein [Pirellulales bacterium]|nr:redoxin family protein [Pirellulales bacterium]